MTSPCMLITDLHRSDSEWRHETKNRFTTAQHFLVYSKGCMSRHAVMSYSPNECSYASKLNALCIKANRTTESSGSFSLQQQNSKSYFKRPRSPLNEAKNLPTINFLNKTFIQKHVKQINMLTQNITN